MTYIAKINIGRPVFHEALQTVPDMRLHIEDVHRLRDDQERFIFWAAGDDFETFEAALAGDPSVESFSRLNQFTDRRLYRGILSEDGLANSLYSIAGKRDIVPRSVTLAAEGTEFLARFPSREALIAFRDAARERNRDFELHSLYEEKPMENDGGRTNRYGITDAQRDALLAALEHGYFAVPRQTTMETIADDLGISTSALSSRLRRGQQALLRNTVVQDTHL
ncbi:bacterio-opsin activator (plasmid) [Halorientalis sp. IM1011]|uniref:helix-turn-helix domain-containing protein n=1 Tax=Halorientalis sp. IM1011 TaxID=1932360 RepID=UPI00097CD067|nr:helix-turn-helix domain-containing protein [Halorientalis sp. IM1011]AQL44779.1 bacterio-opsin activator [Halorientalis sp. IM1011]